MSVISAQGSASSNEQAAWDLGQLARSLYDQWKNDETDRFALQLAAEKRAKAAATTLAPSAQAVGKSSARGGRGGKGMRRQELPDVNRIKIPRSISNRVTFDRFILTGVFNTSTTLSILRQDNISQSLDPNATAYGSLFDSFCILRARWSYTSVEAPGGTGTCPITFLVREMNLFTATTVTALQGYQSCQEKALDSGRSNSMTVCPEAGIAVGSGPVAQGGNYRGWLNLATSSAVLWYGTSFGVQATGAAVVQMMYKIEVDIAYVNGD